MRIAILGASGFLGQDLLATISQYPNFDVEGFSRTGKLGLSSYTNLFENLEHFDFIVNASVGYGRTSPIQAFQANIEFPLEVIRRLVETRRQATFINLDSFFTKFPIPYYFPLKAYSLTKSLFPDLAAELINDAKSARLRFANFRIEHVFGSGDSPEKFLMWLRNQMAIGVPRIALTEGLQKRDFIHLNDASRLIGAGIQRFDALDLNQPLEIGTGQSIQVRSFVELAARIWGFRGVLAFGEVPERVGEIPESSANPYLAKAVGFGPFLSAEEGLRLVQ